ncbi:MAG: molybdenum cofactor guanylyltransferase [Bacteroidota bacterium]
MEYISLGEIRGFFYFYLMQITGIILAGGKSSRMGTDKALLELGGITLLEKAIGLCQSACSSILISSNNPKHRKPDIPLIPDEIENCGPMGGIYSCMKKSLTDWNFVVSVDSPLVIPEFIGYLISETEDCDVVVPVHSKGKEPLIALYHKQCLPEMERMLRSGNFKMHNLFHSVKTKWIDTNEWLVKYPKLFYNINRPEELKGSF